MYYIAGGPPGLPFYDQSDLAGAQFLRGAGKGQSRVAGLKQKTHRMAQYRVIFFH